MHKTVNLAGACVIVLAAAAGCAGSASHKVPVHARPSGCSFATRCYYT